MKKAPLAALLLAAISLLAGCAGTAPSGNGTIIVITPAGPSYNGVAIVVRPGEPLNLPLVSSTANNSFFDTNFPPTKTRNVPAPAPCPWPDVPTYTEQTYEIDVRVGDEFAIGMFANMDLKFSESYDSNFVSQAAVDQLVKYDPVSLDKYGTDWFLYKATRAGTTELAFHYPIEYTKLFKIVIH